MRTWIALGVAVFAMSFAGCALYRREERASPGAEASPFPGTAPASPAPLATATPSLTPTATATPFPVETPTPTPEAATPEPTPAEATPESTPEPEATVPPLPPTVCLGALPELTDPALRGFVLTSRGFSACLDTVAGTLVASGTITGTRSDADCDATFDLTFDLSGTASGGTVAGSGTVRLRTDLDGHCRDEEEVLPRHEQERYTASVTGGFDGQILSLDIRDARDGDPIVRVAVAVP